MWTVNSFVVSNRRLLHHNERPSNARQDLMNRELYDIEILFKLKQGQDHRSACAVGGLYTWHPGLSWSAHYDSLWRSWVILQVDSQVWGVPSISKTATIMSLVLCLSAIQQPLNRFNTSSFTAFMVDISCFAEAFCFRMVKWCTTTMDNHLYEPHGCDNPGFISWLKTASPIQAG